VRAFIVHFYATPWQKMLAQCSSVAYNRADETKQPPVVVFEFEEVYFMVTVIVPVFNVAAFLPQCAESVLGQTYDDIEVLLIDDGSNDGSAALCDAYAARDTRVRVVHQTNRGLSAARNAGLALARGEFVLFVDGDDWIAPHLLATCMAAAQKTGAEVVQFACCFVRDDAIVPFEGSVVGWDHFTPARRLAYFYQYQLSSNVYNAWLRLLRRDFIERYALRFADTRQVVYEDVLFGNCLWAVAQSAVFLREPLYFYRQREGSLLTSQSSLGAARIAGLIENTRQFAAFCAMHNKTPALLRGVVPVTAFALVSREYARVRFRFNNPVAAAKIACAIYALRPKGVFWRAALGRALTRYAKARGYDFAHRLALRALAVSFALGFPKSLLGLLR
jgi:glycosyltransferase involved in cell wall biosynthesis